MKERKREDEIVYGLLTLTWARLPDWLAELEKTKERNEMRRASREASARVGKWMKEHPLGSCSSRGLRALGVFLRTLDEEVEGVWEQVPEGVRNAIARAEAQE